MVVSGKRLLRAKVAFEWRMQRDSHTIVTRVEPPPDYEVVKKSQLVAIPDRFVTAKRLLDVFDRICAKSLAKLGKRKPPCTLVSCQLLGSPKQWEAGREDFRMISTGDGRSMEHLILAHVKDEAYVCCSDADAWEAARRGKLSLKHFVIRSLGAGMPSGQRKAQAACSAKQQLRELAAGDAEATAAIAAAGQLVATCASMESGAGRRRRGSRPRASSQTLGFGLTRLRVYGRWCGRYGRQSPQETVGTAGPSASSQQRVS